MKRETIKSDLWQKSRWLYLLQSGHFSGTESLQTAQERKLIDSILLAMLHHISLASYSPAGAETTRFHLARALTMACLAETKIRETDYNLYTNSVSMVKQIKLNIFLMAGERLTRDVECDHKIILQRRWPYDKIN